MRAPLRGTPWLPGRRWAAWFAFASLLIAAPAVFGSGAGLSILSQMAVTMIFALSYNMLLGQGGMLSFGHSIYSGLAAFCVAHAMNLAGSGLLSVPVTLMPLIGALAGMAFGVVFGWVTTRKAGMTFAMITLGLVELVHACSLIFPEFFGGEAGVSFNRVVGNPVLGLTYGPQIQVYYLIAFWLFASTALMYAFTLTPLGRILNAVRDNPERAAFIGYNVRVVRHLTMIASAGFAGIAGALSALNYEIVNGENVGIAASGAVLLFTFIGGAGYFFGPMIGAAVGVFMTVVIAAVSSAWLLYLGIFFIVMVLYAPGGIASLLVLLAQVARNGGLAGLAIPLLRVAGAALVGLAGLVLLVEMLYHLTLDVGTGPAVRVFGLAMDTSQWTPWIVAALLLGAGCGLFARARHTFGPSWAEATARIAHAGAQERPAGAAGR